jgi:hypothetical protein
MIQEDKIEDLLVGAVKTAKKKTARKSPKEILANNTYTVKNSKVEKESGAELVDFSERKRTYQPKSDDLLEWSNRDFSLYIKNKYRKRYSSHWSPSIPSITLRLNNIKEVIDDLVGFCDNITFKDYIDFFFSEWADYWRSKNKGKVLYLTVFYDKQSVKDFASKYDYQSSVKNYLNDNKTEADSPKMLSLSNKMMEQSHLLGISNLVEEYGIILSANWLIYKRNYDGDDVIKQMHKALLSLHKKKILSKAIEATEKYSPYPSRFLFKDINSLGVDIVCNIDWVDSRECLDFLKELHGK